MLIISQHTRLLHIPFPDYTVFRVNIAWIKTKRELYDLLSKIENDIFLDFPKGRIKPPKPVLKLSDLIEPMRKFSNIKYFAITNAKNADIIDKVRMQIPERIRLVPKIESKAGIDNLEDIFSRMRNNEKYIMLDKEDLYTDLNGHKELFEQYVKLAKDKCKRGNFKILELQGVIFSDG